MALRGHGSATADRTPVSAAGRRVAPIRPAGWRKGGASVLVVVVLALSVWAIHRSLPAPGAVWNAVRTLEPVWAAMAVLAQGASLAAYVVQQRGMLRALGGRMSVLRAVDLTFARHNVFPQLATAVV